MLYTRFCIIYVLLYYGGRHMPAHNMHYNTRFFLFYIYILYNYLETTASARTDKNKIFIRISRLRDEITNITRHCDVVYAGNQS